MIKKESIELLKSQLDIVDVIRNYITLKKEGSSYKGLCPFHAEKTPSFVVSPSMGIYHCFGCHAKGDAIEFVKNIENITFTEAVEKIAAMYNFNLEYTKKNDIDIDINLLEFINNFYEKKLINNSFAYNYLLDRGVSKSTIEKFKLGFAPSSQEQIKYLSENFKSLLDAEKLGIIVKGDNGYYARLIDRITFPIFSEKGKIIAFGGRTINNHPAKYINYSNTILFNKSRTLYGLNFAKDYIRKTKKIILTEGYMDVIMLHQAGYQNTIATLGTALTNYHIPILSKFDAEVIVAYDGDSAGKDAAYKASLILFDKFKGGVKLFEEGKDPADLVKENKEINFNKYIDFKSYIFSHLESTYNLSDITEKRKLIEELKKIISSLNDEFVKDDFASSAEQYFAIKKSNFFKPTKIISQPQQENINLSEAIIIKTLYFNRNLIDNIKNYLKPYHLQTYSNLLDKIYNNTLNEEDIFFIVVNDKVVVYNENELKNHIFILLKNYYSKEIDRLLKTKNLSYKKRSFYQKLLRNEMMRKDFSMFLKLEEILNNLKEEN